MPRSQSRTAPKNQTSGQKVNQPQPRSDRSTAPAPNVQPGATAASPTVSKAPASSLGLWPLRPMISLVAAIISLVVLVSIAIVLKTILRWPADQAESSLLIGVVVISLVPVALALADMVIQRGGVIEYGGLRLDFSSAARMAPVGLTIPANIGAGTFALTDSDTAQILTVLNQAIQGKVAVIDLEGGSAWWETRLLVLLAGAVRLGAPKRIVFTATDHGRPRRLIGWAPANELLEQLVRTDPQYDYALAASRTAAAELRAAVAPPQPGKPPPPPSGPLSYLAQMSQWMALDPSGRPNRMLAEQILQRELGQQIEAQGGGREISIARLEALFRPILSIAALDLSQSSDAQIKALSDDDELYVAVTNGGDYVGLTSKVSLLCNLLPSFTSGDEAS